MRKLSSVKQEGECAKYLGDEANTESTEEKDEDISKVNRFPFAVFFNNKISIIVCISRQIRKQAKPKQKPKKSDP